MVSADLLHVLKTLHDAGASRVAADQLDWTSDMTPAILRALNMQYIISRNTKYGRAFSLTEAGYRALGVTPPNYMSFSRMVLSIFGK